MIRSRRIGLAALAAACLSVSGCASIQVTTDWDREVDFTGYHSFRWAPTQETDDYRTGDVSLLDTRVRRAVVGELEARGLQHREEDRNADLLLVYRVNARNRADVYRGHSYRGYRGRVVAVDRYREGTLVLMFVDPERDQVVWQGTGVGVIQEQDRAGMVSEAISEILKDFPPE